MWTQVHVSLFPPPHTRSCRCSEMLCAAEATSPWYRQRCVPPVPFRAGCVMLSQPITAPQVPLHAQLCVGFCPQPCGWGCPGSQHCCASCKGNSGRCCWSCSSPAPCHSSARSGSAPHSCAGCLQQCCLSTVGCTPWMMERGPIWPSDIPTCLCDNPLRVKSTLKKII